ARCLPSSAGWATWWNDAMTRPVDLPDDVADLAFEYLVGTMPAAELAAFERRLTADAELAAEVERLRRVLGLLPLTTTAEPPAPVRARGLEPAEQSWRPPRPGPPPSAPIPPAAASDTAPRTATVVPFRTRAPRRVVWSRFAAAAAAGLALVLGIDAWQTRRELS